MKEIFEVSDLMKARPHKYIKRTGSPGAYRYWYKMPDGSIQAKDDMQEHGKREHIYRLVAAKLHGHHAKTDDEIAREVGVEKLKVRWALANMRQAGRRAGAADIHEAGKKGHDFGEHHMKEAMTDTTHADYSTHVRAAKEAPAPARSRRPRAPRRTDTERAASRVEGARAADHPAPAAPAPGTRAAEDEHYRRRAEAARPPRDERAEAALGRNERKLKDAGLPDRMIKEFIEGFKVHTPGEMEGEKTTSFDRFRDDLKERILDHVATNAREGRFEVGFKYLGFDEEGSKEGLIRALKGFGFNEPTESTDPDRPERKILTFVHPTEKMVFQAAGGYSTLVGPTEETNNYMHMFLEAAKYVKDVSPYHDGLYGGMDRAAYERALGATPAPAPAPAPAAAPAAATPAPAAESTEARRARLRAALKEGGIDLSATPAPAPAPRAAESVAAVRRLSARSAAIAPGTAGATALEVEPAFREAEEPIKRMVETQTRGGNPYLDRAKEVWNRINSELKPERKEIAKFMLGALEEQRVQGGSGEADLLARYKRISGNARVRTLPKDEFEKATFMTLDEIMENKPIDIEVERMKRGYGARQFARFKPFLKASWVAANASAPPPYPTFGDLKSWTEHEASGGGPKPSWASPRARTAVPHEFHQIAVKDSEGKPMYPPAWMPLHLAPVWHYVAKKVGKDAYASRAVPIEQGKVVAGAQAQYHEGVIVAALRKYVQMRGGPDQLVDIPSSKLAEVGLAHHDIFKGKKEFSDAELKKLLTHKIVDPVALLPFIDEELGRVKKSSFVLTVDAGTEAVALKKSYHVTETQKKIEMVKSLLERKKVQKSWETMMKRRLG